MNKSYTRKIIMFCSAMILCSVLVLDSFLMVFILQYFKQDRYEMLHENVQMASRVLAGDEGLTPQQYEAQMDALLNMTAAAIDANFFVADESGSFVFTASGGRNDERILCGGCDGIPPEMLAKLAQEGELYDMRKFGGMYRINCYTYAAPAQSFGGDGYIIASIPINRHLSGFMFSMLKICLAATIPVVILSCVISYLSVKKMLKPLKLAATAAQQFGKGDFVTRLPVESDDEIGVLMREMNNMAQSLAANDSIQRSFVANVSHELKTPMTTISGFIDGILDGTIPQKEQRHYLRLVSEEVKRLSRLVRTMLNLSKIEAGEMKLNKTGFNILDPIVQVLSSFESRIEEHHLEIRGLDIDPIYVSADEDLIHQALYNLVENAVKFTNENGYIAFDIYRKESKVYVAIQNSGLGLTKEELDNVFKRFYKSDRSRGLDKNGFGLGLYIVHSIITAHGGEIEVESIEGEYCRFTLSLDEAAEKQQARRWGSKGSDAAVRS